MMNEDVKTLWTTRLESGQDEQTKGWLNNRDGKCCLGVLCEIAVEQGVEIKVRTNDYGNVVYDDLSSFLPRSVQEWAGLDSDIGRFPGPYGESAVMYNGTEQNNLADLNDEGMTFEEIAAVIKEKF